MLHGVCIGGLSPFKTFQGGCSGVGRGVSMDSGNPLSNSVHTAKLGFPSVIIHAHGFNF